MVATWLGITREISPFMCSKSNRTVDTGVFKIYLMGWGGLLHAYNRLIGGFRPDKGCLFGEIIIEKQFKLLDEVQSKSEIYCIQ